MGIIIINGDLCLCEVNDRPIIGILSHEIPHELDSMLPQGHNYTTYIDANYVRWAESGGARVAPIIVDILSPEYFSQLFSGINGLIIPGAGVDKYISNYANASKIFFDLARKENDAGDVFPIWGVCLGFGELLAVAREGDSEMDLCKAYAEALPLNLVSGWEYTKLFSKAPKDVIEQVTKLPVNVHFHLTCLFMKSFYEYKMEDFWTVLATNTGQDGLEFISAFEAK